MLKNVKSDDKTYRKQIFESLTPEILGAFSPIMLEENGILNKRIVLSFFSLLDCLLLLKFM